MLPVSNCFRKLRMAARTASTPPMPIRRQPPAPTNTWPYDSSSADVVQSCDCSLPLEPWPPPAAYTTMHQQTAL